MKSVAEAGVAHAFDFHGLSISVATDVDLRAALEPILGPMRCVGREPYDITFTFSIAPDAAYHVVERPPASARTVYASELGGDIRYDAVVDRYYMQHGRDLARVACDPERGRVWVSLLPSAVRQMAVLAYPIVTFPMMEMLKRRRRYAVHAAGVMIGNNGVLFPGTSGVGKSTLTLALLRAGCDVLGDDLLFLERRADGLYALAFTHELHATDDTVQLIPELQGVREAHAGEGLLKYPIQIGERFGKTLQRECRPGAVVFPRIAGTERTLLAPLDYDQALLELVPNVMLTDKQSSQEHLNIIADLARTCDCYRLDAGRDLAELAAVVYAFLK